MPTYDFKCLTCGVTFEVSQGMNDGNPTCQALAAPPVPTDASEGSEQDDTAAGGRACGGDTQKLISRGTFHLKGGGWYKDGY